MSIIEKRLNKIIRLYNEFVNTTDARIKEKITATSYLLFTTLLAGSVKENTKITQDLFNKINGPNDFLINAFWQFVFYGESYMQNIQTASILKKICDKKTICNNVDIAKKFYATMERLREGDKERDNDDNYIDYSKVLHFFSTKTRQESQKCEGQIDWSQCVVNNKFVDYLLKWAKTIFKSEKAYLRFIKQDNDYFVRLFDYTGEVKDVYTGEVKDVIELNVNDYIQDSKTLQSFIESGAVESKICILLVEYEKNCGVEAFNYLKNALENNTSKAKDLIISFDIVARQSFCLIKKGIAITKHNYIDKTQQAEELFELAMIENEESDEYKQCVEKHKSRKTLIQLGNDFTNEEQEQIVNDIKEYNVAKQDIEAIIQEKQIDLAEQNNIIATQKEVITSKTLKLETEIEKLKEAINYNDVVKQAADLEKQFKAKFLSVVGVEFDGWDKFTLEVVKEGLVEKKTHKAKYEAQAKDIVSIKYLDKPVEMLTNIERQIYGDRIIRFLYHYKFFDIVEAKIGDNIIGIENRFICEAAKLLTKNEDNTTLLYLLDKVLTWEQRQVISEIDDSIKWANRHIHKAEGQIKKIQQHIDNLQAVIELCFDKSVDDTINEPDDNNMGSGLSECIELDNTQESQNDIEALRELYELKEVMLEQVKGSPVTEQTINELQSIIDDIEPEATIADVFIKDEFIDVLNYAIAKKEQAEETKKIAEQELKSESDIKAVEQQETKKGNRLLLITKDVAIAHLKQDFDKYIKKTHTRLRERVDFMLEVLKINNLGFEYAGKKLRRNIEFIKQAVTINENNILFLENDLKKDPAFMLELLEHNPELLKFVDETLRFNAFTQQQAESIKK